MKKEHNKTGVFVSLGVNHDKPEQREADDFYTTDPIAMKYLLHYEKFDKNVWECACGNGNLVRILEDYGYAVKATDLHNRGCPGQTIQDFLQTDISNFDGDIITNPPYSHANDFLEQSYKLTKRKVAMFLKVQFLETIGRFERIFKNHPPKTVYVFVKRMPCYRNDDRSFKQSAVCYCWFVWDKEYTGETVVKWIPNHTLSEETLNLDNKHY